MPISRSLYDPLQNEKRDDSIAPVRSASRISLLIIIILLLEGILYAECNRGRGAEIGDWITYNVVSSKTRMEITLSIVGNEKVKKENAIWFEIIMRSDELDFIIKRLVSGDPLNPIKVYRQIVKIINKKNPGYAPAIEIPTTIPMEIKNGLDNLPCIELKGEEGVYKFGRRNLNASFVKRDSPQKSLVIYSKDLPFFGLIKMETDNARIELVDFGKGASTKITEEPIRFDIPPDMSQKKNLE